MIDVGQSMDGIFEYTEQALHVSFLILSQPGMEEGQMRRALIRAMEAVPRLTGPAGDGAPATAGAAGRRPHRLRRARHAGGAGAVRYGRDGRSERCRGPKWALCWLAMA